MFGVEEQAEVDPLDMALDADYRDEEDERSLQNFRNICCSQCGLLGPLRSQCNSQCTPSCPPDQCVNVGLSKK